MTFVLEYNYNTQQWRSEGLSVAFYHSLMAYSLVDQAILERVVYVGY